ncbi:hypothetical protein Q5P01_000175 [Channa striata]|uniref:Uncharacterized protein n=1 Tax=Channa striata TaxID=64152 RepID=A0AA88LEC8_CHASR|nr:hypothetical protein Q5P01_000175 [Channa striata]
MTENLKQSPGDWGEADGDEVDSLPPGQGSPKVRRTQRRSQIPVAQNHGMYGMGDRMIRGGAGGTACTRKGRRGWYSLNPKQVFGGDSGVPVDAESTSVQREAPVRGRWFPRRLRQRTGNRTAADVHAVPPGELVSVPPSVRDTCTVATMTENLKQSPGDWGEADGDEVDSLPPGQGSPKVRRTQRRSQIPVAQVHRDLALQSEAGVGECSLLEGDQLLDLDQTPTLLPEVQVPAPLVHDPQVHGEGRSFSGELLEDLQDPFSQDPMGGQTSTPRPAMYKPTRHENTGGFKTATSEDGQRTAADVHAVPPGELVSVPPSVRDTCTVATMTENLKQSPGDWGEADGDEVDSLPPGQGSPKVRRTQRRSQIPVAQNHGMYGMGDRMIREVQEEQPARRKGRRGWYSLNPKQVFGGDSGVPVGAESTSVQRGLLCRGRWFPRRLRQRTGNELQQTCTPSLLGACECSTVCSRHLYCGYDDRKSKAESRRLGRGRWGRGGLLASWSGFSQGAEDAATLSNTGGSGT